MGSKFVASRTSKSGRDLKYLIKLYKSILKLQTWAFLDMTLNLKAIQKTHSIMMLFSVRRFDSSFYVGYFSFKTDNPYFA